MPVSVRCRNVQLCGPVTSIDYDEACAMFHDAATRLRDAGAHAVWSPTEKIPRDTIRERAMRRCIANLVNNVSVLVTLPMWECSPGACVEVAVAQAIGIHVMTLEEALASE